MIQKSFDATLGGDCLMGSFAYGPSFAGHLAEVQFGAVSGGVFDSQLEYSSAVPGDGLTWSGGTLGELVLPAEEVAELAGLEGLEYRVWLTGGGIRQLAAQGTITILA